MQKDFPESLIKGKIAELIFDLMFRASGKYTVIPFGFESTMPSLQQAAKKSYDDELFETIRNAPDFALVSHAAEAIHLVEVKYRSRPDLEDYRKTAKRIFEQWKLAWIFYATPEGFYFDKCNDLMDENSMLTPLSSDLVSAELQDKYHAILKKYLG